MIQIFNTSFELALRVILQLYCVKCPMKKDIIVYYDLVSTYGASYGILEFNLNGNNPIYLAELKARNSLISDALCEQVKNGLIKPIYSKDGFSYQITDLGTKFANKLANKEPYTISYIDCFKTAYKKLATLTLEQLRDFVVKEEQIIWNIYI